MREARGGGDAGRGEGAYRIHSIHFLADVINLHFYPLTTPTKYCYRGIVVFLSTLRYRTPHYNELIGRYIIFFNSHDI